MRLFILIALALTALACENKPAPVPAPDVPVQEVVLPADVTVDVASDVTAG